MGLPTGMVYLIQVSERECSGKFLASPHLKRGYYAKAGCQEETMFCMRYDILSYLVA
jgi:hypothetical protein